MALGRLRPRRTSLVAKRAGYLSPPRVMLLRLRPLNKVDLGRRGRPNAQTSVGFVPGAKARSAHQSRGLASLVRVTWCFDCSPHGSAGSTGRAEAVVGITCPKPAGRRCWVATAGDCTISHHHPSLDEYAIHDLIYTFYTSNGHLRIALPIC